MVTETMMPVDGIELCVETFGEPGDPALLLIAGAASSMDWWEDEFCRRLAAGGRFVIRYDHRDTGRSTSYPVGAPPYSDVDLAHDALGVLDALGVHRAHLVGLSMGGLIAQRLAVERPHRVLSLVLMSSSPGPGDDDLPLGDTGDGTQDEEDDWSDRRASVRSIVTTARRLGGPFTAEEPQLRRLAERVFDRTQDMAASQTNHYCCAGGPPVRSRLGEITVPTLILHGTLDKFLPGAHARALRAEIPGSRLVWLEGVGHEFPPAAVWNQVIDEIIDQAGRRTQPA
ncbi:alpha/beta fold hydrolase [Paractinoplanes atraurantiacus]|uniref:alpha/beta fold hydrolase n=1 Tax=Paractinoplanes atraurantiacus TaxID=1036182 RepID=UPI001FE5E9FF|nr:alpha/beta hydrolase [Actinoplanes atraurantiacus]